LIEELIAARPANEAPLIALHAAIRIGLEQVLTTDRQALLIRTSLVLHNPVLRSRNLLAQDTTRELFTRDWLTAPGWRSPTLPPLCRHPPRSARLGPR
jgi:hypothetical protein